MGLRKKRAIIYGLYHLGSVTAASLAKQFDGILGLDFEIGQLDEGRAPLYEPGLDALISQGLCKNHLAFTTDLSLVQESDIIWVTFDTPVDEKDQADVSSVEEKIRAIFPWIQDGTIILISSQLPVGTTRAMQAEYHRSYSDKTVFFACSPENLRLGNSLKAFMEQERIVIGTDSNFPKERLENLLSPFAEELLWVSIESAEMTKHALNTFLALCVTYTNELASVCGQVGADAYEVEQALRKEPRVGKKAFIRPGEAFGGGTLARDVNFLMHCGKKYALKTQLIDNIIKSNDHHKLWAVHSLTRELGDLRGKNIGILGLAYKPRTSETRSSIALHLCTELLECGAHVAAFDPQVRTLPESFKHVKICKGIVEVMNGADALVLATEWEEFRHISGLQFSKMNKPLIIDQTGFLNSVLPQHNMIKKINLGRRQ